MVKKSSRYDVVIAGGGMGGLVSAAYLARAGFKPLVLESLPRVGGRIGSINYRGYAVDVCSYISYKTLLEVMDELKIDFKWCELPPNRAYIEPMDKIIDPFPVLADVDASAAILGQPREVVLKYKEIMDRLSGVPREQAPLLKKTRIIDWISPQDWFYIKPALAADWQFRPWIINPEQAGELSVGEMVSILTSGGPTEQPVPMKKLYPADPEVGGNQAIPEAFARIVLNEGGAIKTRSEVVKIAVDCGRVVGITYLDENGVVEEVPAGMVFCDIAIWDVFDRVLDKKWFPDEMIDNAHKLKQWNISNIAIGVGLKSLPHRRQDGKLEDFPGWNRLLLGPREKLYYGGGYIITSLPSPKAAPKGKHLLYSLRWVPEKTIDNLDKVKAVVAENINACRRIYDNWDEVCEWVKFFTVRKSSPIHSTTTIERPAIKSPVEGLYFVADTTETGNGRPYCIDLSCYQGREAAKMIIARRR